MDKMKSSGYILLGQQPRARFNTWKVRKDLVDVDRVQQRVAERRRTALEAANRQQDDKINLPTIGRVRTVGGDIRGDFPTPSLSRARPAVAQSVCGSIREGRQMDSRHSLPAGIALQSQDRYKNIKADLVEAAEDYLQKNPQSDRRVIDKALRSSTAPADEPKRKSQPANTKQEVAKWLEQATDEEQEIALHFFRSVGGMRLMGTGGKPEMNTRHQTLLSALETGEAGNPHLPRLSYRDEQKRRERKQRNLQFVRLLSPKTLNNRQELQSWHHLPAYRQANRADNVRSHYTQPQKVRPLHFTIHPDWGP